MSKGRKRVPDAIQTEVFTRSLRRCCICYRLRGDTNVKNGQLAHLDDDPSNNDIDNLAYLCLDCHDRYDTKTSQSKGLTPDEVKAYRDRLYRVVETLLQTGGPGGDIEIDGNVSAGDGSLGGHAGSVLLEGGKGGMGARGGHVRLAAGNYRAGNGGVGPGGDFVVKGGDGG